MSASGQIDRSEINGTVTDASGAVIQGATIVLTEESTGHSRTAVSGTKGTYVFPALSVGRFTIVVHMDGFTDARIADLDVNSGNTRTINAVLRAGTTQVVSVEADRGANLDKDNATLGGTVESVQIARLPLNGRNISTLELLAPGAIDTGTGQQASIHFVGQGIDDNNFRLDGVDASGIYRQAVKSALRLQFSTEAVAEFKVDSAGYTADTGGSAGAQVSLISKRGTNQFHGAVFEYLRNSFFDAQGPFKAKNPQTFRLNQFGGNVGGPIWRGRTYFFANYEGFRQSLSGVPQIATVPTQAFRQRVLAAQPALAPWFNAYPIGTTPASDPNAALVTYNVPSPSQENSGVMRIDHRFNEHDSMYGRYNIDDGSSVSALNVFQGVTVNSRIQNFVLEELHIFSPTLLNEFEFGFNRNTYLQAQNTGLPYNISITGFTPAAENYSKAQIPQSFSLNDTLTKVIGQHTLKMGVDLRRVMINEGNSVDGTLTYVGASTPTGIDYTNLLNGRLDSILVTAALTTRGLRKNQYMGYFQDQWKMTSELTINMGLRYNFFAPFHEKSGNAVPFDIPMCGGYCTPGGDFNLPDYLNLDPRVGLAYSPNALKGSTVLRAGFGIYHGETQLGDEDSPAVNTEPSTKLTSSNTTVYTYPSALALIPTTGLATTPRSMLLKRPISYTTQWTASIQQSLGHETTATVTYLGVKGTHLFRRSYTNLINPATGTRPLPQYPSAIDTKINAGMSIFHALQFSMTRRYHNGIFVSGNYMWSHALDDNSVGAGEANSPQNVAIPSADYASSSNDVRHTLTASIVYELPLGIGKRYMNTSRWADLAVGGWSIDNLLIGRAGLPIDVQISRASSALPDGNNASQRPNRVPGQPIYGNGGINGWLNPAAFSAPANGQWGNLGRNIATGPTLWQDDTAVEKAFRLTERNALTFRAEAFNLLNRSQYANPSSSFGTATFGKITSPVNSSGLVGTGTPRVFEFALRLNY
ncbi:carboxypeptidase regulatory-like domain-containing protein [Terriglobus sp. 2YAB30_2]|uniref:TonB-dependent receptor n=1 Tax=Terriglobus sp. 2YAB30_2 TaxID=3233023 RepID=UPI003F9A0B35